MTLEQILPSLYRVPLKAVNAFVIDLGDDSLVLIDAGTPGDTKAILDVIGDSHAGGPRLLCGGSARTRRARKRGTPGPAPDGRLRVLGIAGCGGRGCRSNRSCTVPPCVDTTSGTPSPVATRPHGACEALAGALDVAVAGVLGDPFRSGSIPVPSRIPHPAKEVSRTRRTAASHVASLFGRHGFPVPRSPVSFSGLATKCMVRTKPPATSRTSAEIGLPPAETTTPGPSLMCAR
jgi:hypothetical protein